VTLPLEPTYTVSALCDEVRAFLGEAFSSLWVAGEVQRFRESQRGHVYFELVEKDASDGVCGKLEAVVWARDWQRVRRALAATGQRIEEGMAIRCRGGIDFYGVGGRLQLVVREVDPVFTLGMLERRRRETLAALEAAGLLDLNRALALPEPPLSIALVTSHGSAAYHDFLATLGESGYGFRVLSIHASVQGQRAEREIVSALALAGRSGVDCVVLVRGGGARSDLAVFDSRGVAEAVARSPLPVLTGLGHEIDEAIADRVAHLALKTPTKVAELLVERVARCDRAAAGLAAELARAARERLRGAGAGGARRRPRPHPAGRRRRAAGGARPPPRPRHRPPARPRRRRPPRRPPPPRARGPPAAGAAPPRGRGAGPPPGRRRAAPGRPRPPRRRGAGAPAGGARPAPPARRRHPRGRPRAPGPPARAAARARPRLLDHPRRRRPPAHRPGAGACRRDDHQPARRRPADQPRRGGPRALLKPASAPAVSTASP
jgi:exodeoxyribonuclease VII large subunit